jgi:hypothetical protein
MGRLGKAQPSSVARAPLEAEYERRKFVLQRAAVMIAASGEGSATLGVLVGAAHVALHLRGL